jgi:hypothetical protein
MTATPQSVAAVRCFANRNPPLVLILSQMNALHAPRFVYLWSTLLLPLHLHLGFKRSLSLGYAHQRPCIYFSSVSFVLHRQFISFSSSCWSEQYVVEIQVA